MKIAHCLFTMETGGSQVLAVELLNRLCYHHDVSLIIINNRYNEKLVQQLNKRVSIYYINRKEGSRNIIPVIKLNWLIVRLNPDVIHCHEPRLAKIIKMRHARLLYTIHDIGIPVSCYHLYDGLVAISDSVYKDVVSKCNAPVSIVYNGVSFESFLQKKVFFMQKGTPLRIVQVSRLMHTKKGQDIMLQALHLLVKKYRYHDFTFDLIGSGQSYQYLSDMVCELGLQQQVRFCGEKDRDWLFKNLAGYHLLVQPSRYEGFGLTILEGLAAGLPVLASNIDGPAEIIYRTPAGFLFDNEDVEGCARQLIAIVQLYNNGEMAGLVKETMPVIEQLYSLQVCVNAYMKEYKLLTCA
jgi:glycosyltransferase involved in cell wall biosynthesis